jgi:hypothetical protein
MDQHTLATSTLRKLLARWLDIIRFNAAQSLLFSLS